MTGPGFVYPEQRDDETGAEYWARVHDMGLPYLWERDKAVPPGPITVTHEWSLKNPDSVHGRIDSDFATDEATARAVLARLPYCTLIKRTRWIAVSDWQEVPDA